MIGFTAFCVGMWVMAWCFKQLLTPPPKHTEVDIGENTRSAFDRAYGLNGYDAARKDVP